jgi:hypothetical protein
LTRARQPDDDAIAAWLDRHPQALGDWLERNPGWVRSVKDAARRDLAKLPPVYGESAVAEAYLMAAGRLDTGVATRDLSPLLREVRQCFLALHDLAPAKGADDPADQLARKREERHAEIRARGTADS